MKRIYFYRLLLIAVFTFSVSVSGLIAQQNIHYADAWGSQGYSIIEKKDQATVINYSLTDLTLSEQLVNGEMMKEIMLPGEFLPNNQGAPNLPGSGRFLALPQGATATVSILSARKETIDNIDIAPSPEIPWDDQDTPLVYAKNQTIYNTDAFYPSTPVTLSEKTKIRGVDAVTIGVTPFQYNPVTKQLIIYRDIRFEVQIEGGNDQYGDERYRSRYWDPLLSDMLLNYNDLPKIDYTQKYTHNTKDVTGCEYLIVTPNATEFTAWADTIRRFRNKQGIHTKVLTLAEIGTNTANGLEDYFDEIYSTWEIVPAAILLLGDYGANAETQITSPIWDGYCVSDNIFADVTGNSMPDIVFARITARNAGELELMINKFIHYETNPPTAENFYNHPITALGWQTERWFQICSETVGGFWKNEMGKEPVRINAVYGGNPTVDPWSTATNTYSVTSYFGPNGLGYIPESPSELGGWSGGTAQQVVNAINDGAFMLQHRDHGYEQGWGEPAFTSSNIPSLTNTDLTFVFSINCLTGKYNYSTECFTEKFHRHGYGALGLIAASEVSYSFVNDTYVWGLFDNMWPEFMPSYGSTPEPRGILPAFGNAAGKYFLQQSGWPYNTNNKEVTYNLFHHHGDAFLTVYAEVPQDLTVVHNTVLLSGLDYFEVTADEGALIALSYDGEILGTAIGTGEAVAVSIEPQLPGIYVDLVITKQNYFRYEQSIQVIPPDGPYILKDSFVINDENGNGAIDYNESVNLDMTMKNVGSDDGTNVVVELTSTDEYIAITNGTAAYGTIPAESQVTLEDAFTFETANNIPDQHTIEFVLLATDGNEVWESNISVMANAPALSIGRVEIIDAAGNGNGMFDPGETVDILIHTNNTGHSISPAAFAEISSANPYLTINSATYETGTIEAGQSATSAFNMSIDAETPVAEYIDFTFTLNSGEYGFSNTLNKPVGLLVEDWESGDFAGFEWEFMGNENWQITDDEFYEGAFSAKSGDIGDGENSRIFLSANVMADDTISFYFKTSTELNRDFLRFYIDTSIKGIWSGDNDWQRVSYPVTAGEHMFTWIYQKNGSEAAAGDAAWIDWIVLPPMLVTSASAGADASICGIQEVPLNGLATNYETLLWTTSGDGTFTDATMLNPVYTPGENDVTHGNVILTLLAQGPSTTVEDQMQITIDTPPVISAGDDLTTCGSEAVTLTSASAENFASILWTTNGDGMFDDPTLLNPVYTPGTNDVATGSIILSLEAEAFGTCENTSDETTLILFALPSATLSGEDVICNGTTTTLTLELIGMAPFIADMGDLGTVTISESPYTMEVTPTATTTYNILSLSDANGCSNPEFIAHTITVAENPIVRLGNDTTICHNHTLVLDAGIDGVTYNWSTGDTERTIEVTLGDLPIGETKTIQLEVMSTDGCTAEDEISITFKDCTGIGEMAEQVAMALYPNPSNGTFTMTLQSNEKQLVTISVLNIIGETILETDPIRFNGLYQHQFQLDNTESGIYFIRITGETGMINQRIVIE
ncbi:MAG TPA: C25 family cysteine peptidase [Bacteroidales bacterium]|nr:C25 family cysteine peptidase [Bacteroidales bacterium]